MSASGSRPIDGALAVEGHRAGLAVLSRKPDARVHAPPSIESRPVTDADAEKRIAAEAAAELVEDGMTVGLGTGSTVAHLLPAIAARGLEGIRCVATSVATEEQARGLGHPGRGVQRAGAARHRDRRHRPGDARRLADQGRRRRPPAREDRRRGGRALRRHLRLEQAGRAAQRRRCRWSSSPSAWPRPWRASATTSRCARTRRPAPTAA